MVKRKHRHEHNSKNGKRYRNRIAVTASLGRGFLLTLPVARLLDGSGPLVQWPLRPPRLCLRSTKSDKRLPAKFHRLDS